MRRSARPETETTIREQAVKARERKRSGNKLRMMGQQAEETLPAVFCYGDEENARTSAGAKSHYFILKPANCTNSYFSETRAMGTASP